ncbi:MAG TPA: LysM domain-containing protein [Rudaea sp.]|jgi:nucleoid-associated protein YgaU|uniref:LysM domain-containing protein n=1 Tax=Rudaea sp. TaxID=2136325 RepID=UPI002F922F92
MSTFAANSRYVNTPTKTCTLPDGTQVNYLARRFVPAPESLALLGTYTVVQGDRLDNIAARVLGDPELFWRICDGNRELRPAALTAAIGRQLRITLPAGFPGPSNA